MSTLWDKERVKRYIRLYGDPRDKKGTQSQLCKDAAELIPHRTPMLLDVGCGIGHLIPHLHEGVNSYTGLDLSPEMLKQAKEYFPEHNFVEKDATTFKYPNGVSFEVVISISMFIHLPEGIARLALKNMWEHVAPGGSLIFGMETLGNSVQIRPSGLLIRNQSPEKVKKMIAEIIPDALMTYEFHQRVVYQTTSDVVFTRESPNKLISHTPVARTTLYKVDKKL